MRCPAPSWHDGGCFTNQTVALTFAPARARYWCQNPGSAPAQGMGTVYSALLSTGPRARARDTASINSRSQGRCLDCSQDNLVFAAPHVGNQSIKARSAVDPKKLLAHLCIDQVAPIAANGAPAPVFLNDGKPGIIAEKLSRLAEGMEPSCRPQQIGLSVDRLAHQIRHLSPV